MSNFTAYDQIDFMVIKSLRYSNTVPAFYLGGEPGVGKSHYFLHLLEVLEVQFEVPVLGYRMQCKPGMGKEDILYTVQVDQVVSGIGGNKTITNHDMIKSTSIIEAMADSSAPGDHICVVLIDELDKAEEEIDCWFLDIFEEGRCDDNVIKAKYGGPLIVDGRRIVFLVTSNLQRQLNAAMYRRMHCVELPFPSKNKLITEIVPKMLGEFRNDFTVENIKFGVNFMLKYRKSEPTKKMVQNELVEIMLACRAGDKEGLTLSQVAGSVRDTCISLEESDRQLVEKIFSGNKNPYSYLCSKLYRRKQPDTRNTVTEDELDLTMWTDKHGQTTPIAGLKMQHLNNIIFLLGRDMPNSPYLPVMKAEKDRRKNK